MHDLPLRPALLAASLLPNPFHAQYLCMLVPFLAIEGGLLAASLAQSRLRSLPHLRPLAGALLAVYLILHARAGWLERERFVQTGYGVPGVWSPQHAAEKRLTTVVAVEKEIDGRDIAVEGSTWPGYFVGSRTSLVVEMANNFGFRTAELLAPAERHRVHVVSQSEVADMIRSGHPRLFVEGDRADPSWASLLSRCGYQVQGSVRKVRLWTAERSLCTRVSAGASGAPRERQPAFHR